MDDEFILARARFFAKVHTMIEQVSVGGSCGAVPPPPGGGLFPDDGNTRAYTPEEAEEGAGHIDAVELMGDWSWRPDRQPQDPGYVCTAEEIARINEVLHEARRGLTSPHEDRCAVSAAVSAAAPLPRPWTVPAYDYRDLKQRPPRINSIR